MEFELERPSGKSRICEHDELPIRVSQVESPVAEPESRKDSGKKVVKQTMSTTRISRDSFPSYETSASVFTAAASLSTQTSRSTTPSIPQRIFASIRKRKTQTTTPASNVAGPTNATQSSNAASPSTAAYSSNSAGPSNLANPSASDTLAPEIDNSYTVKLNTNPLCLIRVEKDVYIGIPGKGGIPTPALGVQREWAAEIKPRLAKDIMILLQSLPMAVSKKEMIELSLCMAGTVVGQADSVDLKIAVAIRCKTEDCQRILRKRLASSLYLQSFSQGPVCIRLGGMRLSSEPSIAYKNTMASAFGSLGKEKVSLEVQSGATRISKSVKSQSALTKDTSISIGLVSACGLSLDVEVVRNGHRTTQYSTIGGLIKLNGTLYGLTAGHPILADQDDTQISAFEPTTISDVQSTKTRLMNTQQSTNSSEDIIVATVTLRRTVPLKLIEAEGKATLGSLALEVGPMSYAGRGSRTTLEQLMTTDIGSDFALIQISKQSDLVLSNHYLEPDTGLPVSITEFAQKPSSGLVYIIVGSNTVCTGQLRAGDAMLVLRNALLDTQIIQTDKSLSKWRGVI
jgi:hypothetical protein